MISRIEHNFDISERERVVLERIKNNPDLHHNALLKQIVPEFMAKTTFEKTRDSLLEKEIIFVKTSGNMKFYAFTENYEEKIRYHIEHNTNNSYHDLKLKIKKLNSNYAHNEIDGKMMLANSLLVNLIRVDSGFTILDSVKNPKKTLYRDEHLTIQQLIHQVFTIIRNDKDFGIVFPIVVSNVGFFMPHDSLDE